MRHLAIAWKTVLSGALLIAGCSSSPEDGDLAARVKQDAAHGQLSGSSGNRALAALATTRPAGPDIVVPADAGAEAYVELALQRNPSIRSTEAKMQRLSERIPQITSLDDPMFEVAPVGQMAETAAGQVGTMTSISQKFPLHGKLEARGQLAAQNVAMAKKDVEQTKLNVMADTRQAYWSYYFATRAIEVTQQSRDLLAEFRQVAEAKYQANLATQQDVIRASVELSNLDNELITLQQTRSTAVAMLNSLLDRPVTAALPAPRQVQLEQVNLGLSQLLADAAGSNPELGKMNEQIEAQRRRLKLAQLQRWPDLTVGLTYNFVDDDGLSMAANGKDQWWLSFGVNLPIWFDRLRAGEREAHRGIQESIAELNGAQDRVAFRVQDALTKVQTQQRLAVLFRDVIVPQAREAVDASNSGYQAGKVDFLTLTDNWRKLLNYQLMYYQSLAELEKDFAQLQQAVGHDLSRQTASSATMPAATTQPQR